MLRAAIRSRVGPTDRRTLISAIHAQASTLHLADDIRREMQLKLVGVESTKDMTLAQLSTVWTRLATLAHDAGLAKPRARKRTGLDERLPMEPPTKEQLDKIEHLYEDLHILRRPMIVMALCRRATKSEQSPDGHPWPQSREEANKLTEALKAMVVRGWQPRDVEPEAVGKVETGAE